MEIKLLPWIEDDVAIEIIGKMISFQMRSLYGVVEAYKNVGVDYNSEEVEQNKDYQYHSQRIGELHSEIEQIYSGEDRDAVIKKAYEEYAPYVKGKYQAMRTKLH